MGRKERKAGKVKEKRSKKLMHTYIPTYICMCISIVRVLSISNNVFKLCIIA